MIEKEYLYDIVKRTISSEIIKNKKYLIAANWKMNKDTKEVADFLELLEGMELSDKNEVGMFPLLP